ncbi:MAG: efflux RND transporter periplasmic adaptor subunit [Planctomycetaceae bacterium]|nr:efflux RND transporter periplasmic adaptor subunit [Planctomycetales bacterium]MCB9925961.1 efflux RND transporter periplasmic adaptor subunit [Planctomycetaceae bacterium]
MSQRIRIPWKTFAKVVAKLLAVTIGIGAAVLVIAWLAGAFEDKIAPHTAVANVRHLGTERTEAVHEVTKDYIEEAIGTLKAASRTVVSAKVLATIEEINVTAGDQVLVGDVLIRLDSKDLEARVKQADQALVAAQATRREAESSYKRDSQMVQQNLIPRAEYDESTRRMEVARAGELQAEQAVEEANAMLAHATIHAHKAGRIVDRLAEPGDTARPGEPILVLYDATSLRLEAPVREQLAVKLRAGDQLNVYIDALEREVKSTIDEIVPQADAPSRSFLVKASLPRSEDLFEGMFGRLRIPAGQRRHLCLATDAIHTVGQLEFVEVVTANDEIEKRFVKTGQVGVPGRVEVLSGLKAGERVVLPPQTANESSNEGGQR